MSDPTETVVGCGCLTAVVAVFFVATVCIEMMPGTSHSPTTTVPANSSWDGGVAEVKRWLKANARDPDSIEFIEWGEVRSSGSGYEVRCKYRAKNGFGAYTVETTIFHMDSHGKVDSTY